MNEVKCLEFLFNKQQMRPNPQIVKVINELKDPLNKTLLQRILGMVNYFKRFRPDIVRNNFSFKTITLKRYDLGLG